MAKRGDANGRSDARGVVLTMKGDDLVKAVGRDREGIDDRRRVLDELARHALAAVDQVAGTIAKQISAPKQQQRVANRLTYFRWLGKWTLHLVR